MKMVIMEDKESAQGGSIQAVRVRRKEGREEGGGGERGERDALHLLLWLMGMAFLLVRIILTMDGGSMDLIILSVASNL